MPMNFIFWLMPIWIIMCANFSYFIWKQKILFIVLKVFAIAVVFLRLQGVKAVSDQTGYGSEHQSNAQWDECSSHLDACLAAEATITSSYIDKLRVLLWNARTTLVRSNDHCTNQSSHNSRKPMKVKDSDSIMDFTVSQFIREESRSDCC